MTDNSPIDHDHDDANRGAAEDLLELFNAEDIIEAPGSAGEDEPISPADDADAPAPG